MAATSTLPVETIEFEILPRLPVKSLLLFKSVCKSWNALISSNNFTKSFRKSNHDSFMLILKRKIENFNDSPYTEFTWIIGCINGLVCLYDSLGYFGTMGFVIWNPATKKCLKIALPSDGSPPKSSGLLRRNYDDNDVLGFGFDSVANDYKIMHVTIHEEQPLLGYIYSCNSRCWSKLAPSHFLNRGHILKHWQPTIINGYPFWLNRQHDFYFNPNADLVLRVILFDVRQEFYRLLPDLSSITKRDKREYSLLNFRNSVAVMYYSYDRLSSGETIDIYIYNDRCSDWSRMCIGPFTFIAEVPFFRQVLQCLSNGDILFVSTHRTELYCANIRNQTIKSLGKLRDYIIYGCTYSDSLVFLDGMKPFYKTEDIRLFFLENDCKSICSKRKNTKKEYQKK